MVMLILKYKKLEKLIILSPRQCNKFKVYKKQTNFDINKYICKECKSIKVNCEHCSSGVRFSGLRAPYNETIFSYKFPQKILL